METLTDIDMSLLVGEGIRGVICHGTHWYAKANNKYMKCYDKDRESSYLKYYNINNLNGWTMSQNVTCKYF